MTTRGSTCTALRGPARHRKHTTTSRQRSVLGATLAARKRPPLTHRRLAPQILFADDADAVPRTPAYDVWSVGVVALELLLGRSDVFSLAPRAQALLYHRLRDKSEAVRAKAAILTSMAELCVYSPEHDTPRVDSEEVEDHVASPPSSCGLAQFNATLRRRDSFGKGFEDHWGLRLLWRLLQWNPERRISAAAAQHHVCGPRVVVLAL